MNLPVDWGTLWLGGFCPVGALGGLPVRGADYAAHPPLDDLLTLPPDTALRADVTLECAEQAWSDRLGGALVVLTRDAYRARRLLHQAAEIQPGEWVGMPANASHDLAESVKHHKATAAFSRLRLAAAVGNVLYALHLDASAARVVAAAECCLARLRRHPACSRRDRALGSDALRLASA